MARSRSLSRSALVTTVATIASMRRGTSASTVLLIGISSSPYPIARGVEKQRSHHLDVHVVAHGQTGVGLGIGVDQSHHVRALPHPDVQMALVAEVLDPTDAPDRRGVAVALGLADAHV